MPGEIVKRTGDRAATAAVEVTRLHWTALTGGGLEIGRPASWSIVDPEALVLASLAFSRRERRLEDRARGWATAAAFLMSKPRLKNVGRMFPTAVRERIGDFARYAAAAGDGTWKRLARQPLEEAPPGREKPIGPLALIEGPTLVLRMRAGFGVNAKADVLAFLLGLADAAADLRVIAAATGLTERTIRGATEEMVLAGFIREIRGRPSSFRVDPEPWARLLRSHRLGRDDDFSIPPWRFWSAVFAFLTAVDLWRESAATNGWSDYVASSRARDLIERHARNLIRAGLEPPPPDAHRGTAYLGAFQDFVTSTCDWAVANA